MTSMINQQLKDRNWFKAQQKRLGFTNQAFAGALGVSVAHVEHMRSGRRRIAKRVEIIIGLLLERK